MRVLIDAEVGWDINQHLNSDQDRDIYLYSNREQDTDHHINIHFK